MDKVINKQNITHPTIFCLGPSGTFSYRAAEVFLNGKPGNLIQLSSIGDVFQKVVENPQSLAVIPIENTIAGVVGVHQDLLLNFSLGHQLLIVDEVDFSIDFALVTEEPHLKNIAWLYAHPHSLEQCQLFKLQHLPSAEVRFTKSTTEAGVEFLHTLGLKVDGTKSTGKKPPKPEHKVAAIIPLPFAEENLVFEPFLWSSDKGSCKIQDSSNNVTRFFILQSGSVKGFDFTKTKTSLYIESKKDEAALLYKILTPFAALGISLSFLHSRPDLKKAWNYNFFIDFLNVPDHPEYSQVCMDRLMQQDFLKVHILGTYNSRVRK